MWHHFWFLRRACKFQLGYMRGVGLLCHTTPISRWNPASKRWDVKHVGVSLTRSCLVGLKHAEVGPPPLEIFNVPLLTCTRARSSDGVLINSATGVNFLQEELNKDVFLWWELRLFLARQIILNIGHHSYLKAIFLPMSLELYSAGKICHVL